MDIELFHIVTCNVKVSKLSGKSRNEVLQYDNSKHRYREQIFPLGPYTN